MQRDIYIESQYDILDAVYLPPLSPRTYFTKCFEAKRCAHPPDGGREVPIRHSHFAKIKKYEIIMQASLTGYNGKISAGCSKNIFANTHYFLACFQKT